ncbi:CLUMA_CG011663, isoform A [Clunio marinus]|uniref:CLUMA_CG011663, isoform A n=1 Tax=Clunio marinus TaxID=568069 RepID=A0A1J1IDF8_9DIPT|nr:CLUMA_CG011663, isoform A [Clunio marinus]
MEMDDSSSPDEKEFPGLYEKNSSKNKKGGGEENESNSSENLTLKKGSEKKDKKSKDKKDRQSYEALGGESEEDEPESRLFRSPSKSKKSKTFKFPSSKKEKREKSQEPSKDTADGTKDKKSKDDPKSEKKKLKKDKKSKSNVLPSGETVFELGDIQPIFGVSLGLAVERSRCHDNVKIPLVVRNCIDYLQEHGLQSEQIYKTEGIKTRLMHLRKCYNNRESQDEELDVPTACSLLKAYLQDLPEPILTTELITRFEEASSLPDVSKQAVELESLIEQLPKCNQILLAWLSRHFSCVIDHEKHNKLNAQSLAVLLSPVLQMSHRLMITILCHAETLFADVELHKYVPPITSTSPNLLETPEEISMELRKQESLLSQIHSEMNAGFVTKRREEELWETQRIITQLKRKLRTFEKRHDSMQKSMDTEAVEEAIDFTLQTTETVAPTETKIPQDIPETIPEQNSQPSNNETAVDINKVYVAENGFMTLHKDHPEYLNLIRLQLENQELMNWKQQLQARISVERAECVRLKRLINSEEPQNEVVTSVNVDDPEYGRLVEQYMKENSLLEQKRILLSKEIFDENISLIQLQVDLAMKQFIH